MAVVKLDVIVAVSVRLSAIGHQIVLHRANEAIICQLDVLREQRVARCDPEVLPRVTNLKMLVLQHELTELLGFHRSDRAVLRQEVLEVNVCVRVNYLD